jgi:hypothetical protein
MLMTDLLLIYRRYFIARINSIARNRDSVVGIVTGYRLEDRGVGVPVPGGSRIFSKASRPDLGSTHPHIQWVPGALAPVIKRPGCEADHSSPNNAEVKKMWISTATPPYDFMA